MTLRFAYDVKKDWSDDKGLTCVPAANNDGHDVLISRNWPYYARYWIPSNDSPDDVAQISYQISVPDGYRVAANGRLVRGTATDGSGLQADGLRLFEWKQQRPTTAYNFVFAVSAFDIDEKEVCFAKTATPDDVVVACAAADVRIPQITYYNKNAANAALTLSQIEKASHAAIYFSKLFGPYAFDKIGFVVSPYPFAMESTSMIVLNKPASAVHEIAHHWWGDNVHIAHGGDFWISEGFTTYSPANMTNICRGRIRRVCRRPPKI